MEKDEYIPQALFRLENFNVGINDLSDNKESDKEKCDDCIEFKDEYQPLKTITLHIRINDLEKTHGFPVIEGATITYESGTYLNKDILEKSRLLLERFILLFAIDNRIEIDKPKVILESYSHYDLKEECINHTVCTEVEIKSEVHIFYKYGIARYKETLNDSLLRGIVNDNDKNANNDVYREYLENDFSILKAIYEVDNIESRYLLQYEFLKVLVGGLYNKPYGSQKLIKNFVEEYYNLQVGLKEKMIGKITDDRGKEKDMLTYYRNVIGHPPVTESDKERFMGSNLQATYAGWSQRISEVILFAIREKEKKMTQE